MEMKEINTKVQETIDSAESISKVNASPFFKEKVMHQIRNSPLQDNTTHKRPWFTPQLQLATLACVVVVNMLVLFTTNETTNNASVSPLAELYGWSDTDAQSLIYN